MSASTSTSTTAENTNAGSVKHQFSYVDIVTSPHFSLIAGPSKKTFYIHKELLGRISPELRKHIHNEMKEGKENKMTLADVREDTIARFIEWAYRSDYTEELDLLLGGEDPDSEVQDTLPPTNTSNGSDKSDSSSRLLLHARLYVLADRFNIPALKLLTFTKLTTILKTLENLKHPGDVADVIEFLTYCFDNLLMINSREKLLQYLSLYAAWNFEVLKKDPSFWTLTSSNPEFVKSLLLYLNKGSSPPQHGTSADTSTAEPPNLKLKSDFLKRKCNSCTYIGVFRVQCGSCQYFDTSINDSGEMIDLNKIKNLTGTGTGLRITCGYCQWAGMPRLYCGKCNYSAYSYV